jgi:hypothetical protein
MAHYEAPTASVDELHLELRGQTAVIAEEKA